MQPYFCATCEIALATPGMEGADQERGLVARDHAFGDARAGGRRRLGVHVQRLDRPAQHAALLVELADREHRAEALHRRREAPYWPDGVHGEADHQRLLAARPAPTRGWSSTGRRRPWRRRPARWPAAGCGGACETGGSSGLSLLARSWCLLLGATSGCPHYGSCVDPCDSASTPVPRGRCRASTRLRSAAILALRCRSGAATAITTSACARHIGSTSERNGFRPSSPISRQARAHLQRRHRSVGDREHRHAAGVAVRGHRRRLRPNNCESSTATRTSLAADAASLLVAHAADAIQQCRRQLELRQRIGEIAGDRKRAALRQHVDRRRPPASRDRRVERAPRVDVLRQVLEVG